MNSISDLAEQVSELRWLVYELGNEMKTLETTAYPLAHRFLMRGLAKRLVTVADATAQSLCHPVPTPVACPDVQPIEQSA